MPVDGEDYRPRQRRRGDRRDHQLHQHLQPVGAGRRRPGRAQGARQGARPASRGSRPASRRAARWSPTISTPAASARILNALGFDLVGYGCTTCIGNSGPLAEPISKAIADKDLVACQRAVAATAISKAGCRPTAAPITSPRRRWWSPMRSRARSAPTWSTSRSAPPATASRCS